MRPLLVSTLLFIAACSGTGDDASDGGGGVVPGQGGGAGTGGTSSTAGGASTGGATSHGGVGHAGFPSGVGGAGHAGAGLGGASAGAGGVKSSGGASGATGGGGVPSAGAGGSDAAGGSASAGAPDSAGGAAGTDAGGSPSAGSGGAPWVPYQPPSACEKHARILTYNPVGDHYLTDAMGAAPSVCADYYIHEPAFAADKTMPRGPAAVTAVHAHGDQFHALAEFHWGGWAAVTGMSWHDKGVLFRQRMLDAGYDPARDSWALNELPSTTKSTASVRQDVMDAVKGLYEGAPGSPPMGGLVFVIGIGSDTKNFSVYKPALEDWLVDAAFWNEMNAHVRWWGQEAYARPIDVCVGSATVAERASHMNDFAMHAAVLSNAGAAMSSAAHAFFDESYVPTQSAFWHGDSYGTTITTLDNMKALVSNEIYASRSWSTDHTYPDWRLALAWNDQLDGATEAEVMDLAARIAGAIHDVYDQGTITAAHACSPSGAFTFCQCAAQNAVFNEGFSTFQTW